jgi:alpha-beta hydrolase superfamily lysophospholipase
LKLTLDLGSGVTTQGLFVGVPSGAKGTVILLHGYKNCMDVTAGFARHLHDNGYNIIAFDQRGHGKNSDPFCSFGYYEKQDVSKVIDILTANGLSHGPFFVLGTSMGAAVGIQAMEADSRIQGGVFDSSFSTLNAMADKNLKEYGLTKIHEIMDQAEGITKAPLEEVSPVESISRIDRPVLVLHGKADDFIPVENANQLHQACHSKTNEILLVDDANHGQVLCDDEPWSNKVWHQVIEFINLSRKDNT